MDVTKCSLLIVILFHLNVFGQGALTPPGPPGPTMKTLAQIEPRTPIASLPFAISQAGVYYLTTNLSGIAGNNGITITADNVTLNLNGFSLTGVGGALAGVSVSGVRRNITVHNGVIRNWPSHGLDLGGAISTVVSGIMASGNLGVGISAGDSSSLSGSVSRDNRGDNIRAGSHSIVTHCIAVGSTAGHGISLYGGFNVISDCTANTNFLHGINASQRSRIHDCIASNNGQSGIHATSVGSIENCVCDLNGFCGILSDAGGLIDIVGNSCSENGTASTNAGAGIRVSAASGSRIERNHLVQNYRGLDVLSPRNIIVRNTAAANSNADYSIAANNAYGPIVNVVNGGDISFTSGSSHPQANFQF